MGQSGERGMYKSHSKRGIGDFHVSHGRLMECKAKSKSTCPFHEAENGPNGKEVREEKARLWKEREEGLAANELKRREAISKRISELHGEAGHKDEVERKAYRKAFVQKQRRDERLARALEGLPKASDEVRAARREALFNDETLKGVTNEYKRLAKAKAFRDEPDAKYVPGYGDRMRSDTVAAVLPVRVTRTGLAARAPGGDVQKMELNSGLTDANRSLGVIWAVIKNSESEGKLFTLVSERPPKDLENGDEWKAVSQRHWLYDESGRVVAGVVGNNSMIDDSTVLFVDDVRVSKEVKGDGEGR